MSYIVSIKKSLIIPLALKQRTLHQEKLKNDTGDMSLSCSCLNKHYIFKFVYFNFKKATLLQTYSFWADILVIIWNYTFQSNAVSCVMTTAGCMDIVKTQTRDVRRVLYYWFEFEIFCVTLQLSKQLIITVKAKNHIKAVFIYSFTA